MNQHGLWSWLRISTLCSIYRAYLPHLNNHSTISGLPAQAFPGKIYFFLPLIKVFLKIMVCQQSQYNHFTVSATLFAFLSLSKRNGNTCRGYIIWISINRRIQLAQFAYPYFPVLQLKLVSQLSILDESRIWPIHRVTAIQTIVRLFVKLLQLNLLYGSFFYIFIFMFTK